MDNIYLTNQEKRLLFFLRFVKKIHPGFDVSQLVSYGLIRRNYSGKRNAIGEQIPDNTYSLTPFELRFRIAQRRARIHRYFTPITVSILTNIAIAALKWLAEWLSTAL